jgi:hypothetical protein
MTTEALTLRRGTAAEELTQNEAFITCINELYNQYTDEIVKSPLEAKELRESRFFQIRALQDITAELTSWVQLKDQLILKFEE